MFNELKKKKKIINIIIKYDNYKKKLFFKIFFSITFIQIIFIQKIIFIANDSSNNIDENFISTFSKFIDENFNKKRIKKHFKFKNKKKRKIIISKIK